MRNGISYVVGEEGKLWTWFPAGNGGFGDRCRCGAALSGGAGYQGRESSISVSDGTLFIVFPKYAKERIIQ